MLSVTYKVFMLSVIMVTVLMLSGIMPSVIMVYVMMRIVIMLNVMTPYSHSTQEWTKKQKYDKKNKLN